MSSNNENLAIQRIAKLVDEKILILPLQRPLQMAL